MSLKMCPWYSQLFRQLDGVISLRGLNNRNDTPPAGKTTISIKSSKLFNQKLPISMAAPRYAAIESIVGLWRNCILVSIRDTFKNMRNLVQVYILLHETAKM